MNIDEVYSAQVLELRRGAIVLAILSQLRAPRYGYALLQELKVSNFSVDAGTLYPLLRRLERQGILTSSWDTAEGRPRKYYELSKDGSAVYEKLLNEWRAMTASIHKMTKGGV